MVRLTMSTCRAVFAKRHPGVRLSILVQTGKPPTWCFYTTLFTHRQSVPMRTRLVQLSRHQEHRTNGTFHTQTGWWHLTVSNRWLFDLLVSKPCSGDSLSHLSIIVSKGLLNPVREDIFSLVGIFPQVNICTDIRVSYVLRTGFDSRLV